MARDKNKGRVEFQDSDGTTYYLKLGTNEFCEIQDELATLRGYPNTRRMFHAALVAGDPSQKDLTLDDAGDLMDDITLVRTKDLLDSTAFAKNVAAAEADRQRREQETKDADSAKPQGV